MAVWPVGKSVTVSDRLISTFSWEIGIGCGEKFQYAVARNSIYFGGKFNPVRCYLWKVWICWVETVGSLESILRGGLNLLFEFVIVVCG